MKHHSIHFLAVLAISTLCDSAWAAAPRRTTKFEELKKITVGPYDNFQTAISDETGELYFTRSQNLSTQILTLTAILLMLQALETQILGLM